MRLHQKRLLLQVFNLKSIRKRYDTSSENLHESISERHTTKSWECQNAIGIYFGIFMYKRTKICKSNCQKLPSCSKDLESISTIKNPEARAATKIQDTNKIPKKNKSLWSEVYSRNHLFNNTMYSKKIPIYKRLSSAGVISSDKESSSEMGNYSKEQIIGMISFMRYVYKKYFISVLVRWTSPSFICTLLQKFKRKDKAASIR